MSAEPSDPTELGAEGAPGRHGRARELAQKQAGGEELSDYDSRLLSAHLEACSECREWAGALPAAEAAAPATTETPADSGEEEPQHAWQRPDRGEDLDAMGKPRRRKVMGETYGPTKTRQVALYVAFIAVIAAVFFGGKLAIEKLDKPPEKIEAQAPWAQPDSPQVPPQHFQ